MEAPLDAGGHCQDVLENAGGAENGSIAAGRGDEEAIPAAEVESNLVQQFSTHNPNLVHRVTSKFIIHFQEFQYRQAHSCSPTHFLETTCFRIH